MVIVPLRYATGYWFGMCHFIPLIHSPNPPAHVIVSSSRWETHALDITRAHILKDNIIWPLQIMRNGLNRTIVHMSLPHFILGSNLFVGIITTYVCYIAIHANIFNWNMYLTTLVCSLHGNAKQVGQRVKLLFVSLRHSKWKWLDVRVKGCFLLW